MQLEGQYDRSPPSWVSHDSITSICQLCHWGVTPGDKSRIGTRCSNNTRQCKHTCLQAVHRREMQAATHMIKGNTQQARALIRPCRQGIGPAWLIETWAGAAHSAAFDFSAGAPHTSHHTSSSSVQPPGESIQARHVTLAHMLLRHTAWSLALLHKPQLDPNQPQHNCCSCLNTRNQANRTAWLQALLPGIQLPSPLQTAWVCQTAAVGANHTQERTKVTSQQARRNHTERALQASSA